ncbi:relaxase/mobilization nuclease domain-containing protein, partial [Marinitenerispora sediminis]
MIAKVMRGRDTLGLLKYLYGPGQANEHIDPHLVAAWRSLGVPEPGREPGSGVVRLAKRLDLFVRESAARPVWHCAVRVAKEDRALTDEEWGEVARRIAAAAGIAPSGDDRACRWVAVRHDGSESQHIHLVATLARQDDSNPDIHNDALRLREECRRLERELGLRATSGSDNTSTPLPTRGETEKAARMRLAEPPRAALARLARRAAVAARNEEEFFTGLEAGGAELRLRWTDDGAVSGYAVAWPGYSTAEAEPVWFSGRSLAPDLSLPRVRARFAGAPPVPSSTEPSAAWSALRAALWRLSVDWPTSGPGARAAAVSAIGDALTGAAAGAPPEMRGGLGAADDAWGHAGRPPMRPHDNGAAG